jgi:hypothetical protein
MEEATTSLSSSKLKSSLKSYLKEHSYPQEERIENAVSSIHSLGVKLEEMAEQVLKCMGYSYTERRKKMIQHLNQ